MTATAALLVIFSAFMHAGWNMFSKSLSPTAGFFLLASWGTVLCFAPVFFLTIDILPLFSAAIWGKLLIAGLFQSIYYLGLASAYRRGALSIAYPLARSFPLFILVTLAYITGQGRDFSAAGLAGLGAIVGGAIILPMNAFRDFRLANYLNPSCAFALVAALGTAGYSFVDDIAMNTIKGLDDASPDWARAMLYLVLESTSTALWLHFLLLFFKRSRAAFKKEYKILLKPALQAGLAIGATYGLVLLAMTQAVNVSYVVGLRQLSIPIGALLGIFVLKEKGSLPRYIGVGMLFFGLILIILG
ncbi:MAG: multidrug DMT transporter permease [Deltaproteobacteria bacterium]|nr:MAG: multidrug DMT transporter permease [Deltaproteobacteria bacterium]